MTIAKMIVGVLDYGVGNIASVVRAFELLNCSVKRIDRAADVHGSDALVLPGVGSFTECMQILDFGGWSDSIREEALIGQKPVLGICLGMQLLSDSGEEGAAAHSSSLGLGLIPGSVQRLSRLGCKKRLPHVGWNSISIKRDSYLFRGLSDGTDFYFVHSYGFVPKSVDYQVASTPYGIEVCAAVNNRNICGTQFHPEKSSRAGLTLLKNFLGQS